MSEEQKSSTQAALEANRARSRLTSTLVDIQARLRPKALLREAFSELRDTSTDLGQSAIAAARRNPAPFIAVSITLVGFLARHQLFRALAPGIGRKKGPKPLSESDSVIDDRASSPGKETEK